MSDQKLLPKPPRRLPFHKLNELEKRCAVAALRGDVCAWPECSAAGVTKLTLHHIIPQSLGGDDRLSNCCLLCVPHHTLIHKFLRIPAFGQRVNMRYKYALAWAAVGDLWAEL